METEDSILKRYEVELAAIAALDQRYYLLPSACLEERRDYTARQLQLEEIRSRLYLDLANYRQHRGWRCRRLRSAKALETVDEVSPQLAEKSEPFVGGKGLRDC